MEKPTTTITWHEIGASATEFPDDELEVLVYDGYLNDTVKASYGTDEHDCKVWLEQITGQPLRDPQYWADVPFPGSDDALKNGFTAIDLIANERQEQISKHGFDAHHDDGPDNSNGELVDAAAYLLGGVQRSTFLGSYPENWSKQYKAKFDSKTRFERLVISAALLAAEIDRLGRI